MKLRSAPIRIVRTAFVLASVLAVVLGAACAQEEQTTPQATTAAELAEVRIGKCVIDQGDVEPAEATGDDFSTIENGTLTVGSDTTFPPFESIEDGEPVGFDIELIEDVADRLDLDAEIQSAAFDTIFTALAADKFDVVISAVTIKADRKETVDFTDTYFSADQSLTVRSADASSIAGIDDLEGKTVGVQAGTTGEECAKNALEAEDKIEDVRSYDTAVDAFTDLAARRVDAVLVDLPTAEQIVEERTGIRVVQVIRTDEKYAIAVSKENTNLREAINGALEEQRADGTYRRLYMKWFDTEPPDS